MSFPTDITVAGKDAVTVTYSQISLENAKSIRSDATRSLGTPKTLTISHEVKGKGMKATDRHLVRFTRVEEDTGSDDIATLVASVYTVLEVPRRIFTNDMILDLCDQMVNFWSDSTNRAKLMNSEP